MNSTNFKVSLSSAINNLKDYQNVINTVQLLSFIKFHINNKKLFPFLLEEMFKISPEEEYKLMQIFNILNNLIIYSKLFLADRGIDNNFSMLYVAICDILYKNHTWIFTKFRNKYYLENITLLILLNRWVIA